MGDYPQTKAEWWQWVLEHQEDLISCIAQFHPNMYNDNDGWNITAPGTEQACEVVRKQIRQESKINPLVLAATYIKNQDSRFAELLDETWFGAPESDSVMSVPGFGVLCDLCSESYLLHEEEENVECS